MADLMRAAREWLATDPDAADRHELRGADRPSDGR